ncbi:hypothetical protein [Actinomadura montaniterrae]|uniref:Uncharacterized protein n=1 Tax=Actinomadura montaniterrae TaxID=1803903 RepID=A0A6L3VXA7_9ACTN|nr:hypothetical protein [Actinomadura montaniterrae]KAB2376956.1 hypothetical protein F9B16_24270 [Actinomadura montaniterrae]
MSPSSNFTRPRPRVKRRAAAWLTVLTILGGWQFLSTGSASAGTDKLQFSIQHHVRLPPWSQGAGPVILKLTCASTGGFSPAVTIEINRNSDKQHMWGERYARCNGTEQAFHFNLPKGEYYTVISKSPGDTRIEGTVELTYPD